MDIVNVNISSLREYENNPRDNEVAVAAVAESIKQFGFKVPIIIDSDNVIIAGHTRRKAAELLGLKKVPCVVADDLTPEQIKAFRLADNKTAELAEWDFAALERELAELSDFDMTAFGFEAPVEYTHIDDLLNDDSVMSLVGGLEKDTFNITFTFPKEKETLIKDYIKDVGKDGVTEEIIMHIEKGTGMYGDSVRNSNSPL